MGPDGPEAGAERTKADAEAVKAVTGYLKAANSRIEALCNYVKKDNSAIDPDKLIGLATGTSIEQDVRNRAPKMDLASFRKALNEEWSWNIDDLYNNLPEELRKQP